MTTWRFLNDGALIFSRYGLALPSETMWKPELAARRFDGGVDLALRELRRLGVLERLPREDRPRGEPLDDRPNELQRDANLVASRTWKRASASPAVRVTTSNDSSP